jgi:hypothetical protein
LTDATQSLEDPRIDKRFFPSVQADESMDWASYFANDLVAQAASIGANIRRIFTPKQ